VITTKIPIKPSTTSNSRRDIPRIAISFLLSSSEGNSLRDFGREFSLTSGL
jgi:hypothetical protein